MPRASEKKRKKNSWLAQLFALLYKKLTSLRSPEPRPPGCLSTCEWAVALLMAIQMLQHQSSASWISRCKCFIWQEFCPHQANSVLMFYPAWHYIFSLFQTAAIIPVPLAMCEHMCWREPLSLWVAIMCGPGVTFKGTDEGQSWCDKPMPPAKLRPQFLLQQPGGLPSCPQLLDTDHCLMYIAPILSPQSIRNIPILQPQVLCPV